MNLNLIISIIFGILGLALGIINTYSAGHAFNKEDKTGAINNNTPSLFLSTGIVIIIFAVFHLYTQYQMASAPV